MNINIHTKNYTENYKKIFLFAIMLIVSIIIALPFILMILTSLKTMGEIKSPVFRFLPNKFMWGNYIKAFQYGEWGRYFLNSIIITVFSVIISLLFNSMAGYSFARLNFKGKEFLFAFILLGLMVPGQVTIVPVFLMMKQFPLVGGNNIFGQGGIGLINTYMGLILPYLAHPFGIFLCRQFYLDFPKSLDDAASIDGLNKWQIYFQVYLPLSKPILATLALFKATQTWNEYLWPLIITNTENMRTVQLGLSTFKGESGIEWNLLMAATTIVILPLIVIFIFTQKYFVESTLTSGLKG